MINLYLTSDYVKTFFVILMGTFRWGLDGLLVFHSDAESLHPILTLPNDNQWLSLGKVKSSVFL